MIHKSAIVLAILLAPSASRANAPPPPPQPPRVIPPQRLVIEPREGKDKQTYLRLPLSVEKKAGGVAAPGDVPAWHRLIPPRGVATVVAGAALSLAVVWLGLRVLRPGRRRLAVASACGLAVVLVVGVSGCPHDYTAVRKEQLSPLSTHPDGNLSGEALLETQDKDGSIHLAINGAELEAFVDKAAPAARP